MAYISNDGNLLQVEPWGRRSVTFFLGICHAFFMFFRSLVNPVTNMFGASSEDSGRYGTSGRDYGPGSGPPRPPRRMGRPNTGSGSSIYTPGPVGGCGCG